MRNRYPFQPKAVLWRKGKPTKRAPDVWDSAAFSSIFLASSFSCSQALSTPAPAPLTQAVGRSFLSIEIGKELMLKIMIFLHGTSIMHKNALHRTRDERVKQVLDGDASLYDFAAYLPIGKVVQKLQSWEKQGAEIVYLSSHLEEEDVERDKAVLQNHGFPRGQVFFRHRGERYNEIAERVLPDILIEDDCESIGGEVNMTSPHIKLELRDRIKSVVVQEFGGIDHLPNDINALRKC